MSDVKCYLAALGFMRQRGLIVCHSVREKAFDFLAKARTTHALCVVTDRDSVTRLRALGVDAYSVESLRTQLLGAEYDLLVIDLQAGLSPDGIALAAGGLRGGGVCVLLMEQHISAWPSSACADYQRMLPYPLLPSSSSYRFLTRVKTVLDELAEQAQLILVDDLSAVLDVVSTKKISSANSLQANSQQRQVVADLVDHLGLALITGPRGAGKSSTLGILADAMLACERDVVLLTASAAGKSAVQAAARQVLATQTLQQLLNEVQADQQSAVAGTKYSKVLLIDESAALPVAVIERLAARYATVVMASTTEGYEGSGQALALKLLKRWRVRDDFKYLTLTQSLRFYAPDPVSELLQRALLLDVESVLSSAVANVAECPWRYISQDQLLRDSALLKQIYGLLRTAHYRTTPDDLRVLLDGPDTHCAVMMNNAGDVVSVCLFVIEGNLDELISTEIAAGRRRPRGHLLVQSMAQHLNDPSFLQRRVGRVMRIAVSETARRKGLASQCLQGVEAWLSARGVNWLGSSFSASAEAVAFWQSQGYELQRMGTRRHPASGEHSALVLKPLGKKLRQ